ncbi:MAG: hypothetical protein ABIL62_12105 [Planctomycetota bacterium]
MQPLKVIKDSDNKTVIGLNISDFVNARVLAASTAETITVPKAARYIIISGNADLWVDVGKTSVVPAADITNGSSPFLVTGGTKELRSLGEVTHISVISVQACIATAEFYA